MFACVCAHRGQKKKDTMIVSCQLGAVNRTQVLCKNNKCSELLSHLSSPSSSIYNKVSPYPISWPSTCHRDQAGLKLVVVLLPLPPEHHSSWL